MIKSGWNWKHLAGRTARVAVAVGVLCTCVSAQQPDEWKAPGRAARKENPVSYDKESVAAGHLLFKQFCVACHGDQGRGDGPAAAALQPKPRNLASEVVADQKDGELFWKIKTGRAPMPTFGPALEDRQVWTLINFIRSLGPKKSTASKDGKSNGESGKNSPAGRLLEAYLRVGSALVAGEACQPASRDLAKIASEMSQSSETWKLALEEIIDATEQLSKAKDRPARHRAFADLSKRMAVLLEEKESGYPPVMAFAVVGEEELTWLQEPGPPRNPYARPGDSLRTRAIGNFPLPAREH